MYGSGICAFDSQSKLLQAYGLELEIMGIVDPDFGHDFVTRRSISGLMHFVGRTPMVRSSRRQSSVQSSTYVTEFVAARLAVKEILSHRYFLRSLGVLVSRASRLFGDNMNVLLNITEPDSHLKKKHLCITYHILHEGIASHVIEAFYVPSAQNYSDFLTKSLVAPVHDYHMNGLLYYVPLDKQLPFG
jgi:hypothetical protein